MTVTGERVVTAEGGFNPTFQRHVAAYALCAGFLGPGRVLDLGAGAGHSHHLLSPRETVGLDVDPDALAGQDRETVVADMRELPFPAASFGSVLAVQSIEHVPDGARVVAEAARVLRPDGVAVFVTPNRLTFGRPDEIIDPYHHIEYDAGQLRALMAGAFAQIELHGIFGSPRVDELLAEQRVRVDRLLRADPLRLRRALPRRLRQRLYDRALTRARRERDPRAAAITPADFELRSGELNAALDLVAVGRRPAATD